METEELGDGRRLMNFDSVKERNKWRWEKKEGEESERLNEDPGLSSFV